MLLSVLLVIAASVTGIQARAWNFEESKSLKSFLQRSQVIADFVNNFTSSTWKAGPQSRFKDEEAVKRQLSQFRLPLSARLPKGGAKAKVGDRVPNFFDARQKWPHCPSIGEVPDQGSCASSWAVNAVGTMTDRICIHSGGKDKTRLSAKDLIACCKACGNGCRGGYQDYAWHYWVTEGIVTGGKYGSKKGCQPYPFPICNHDRDTFLPNCYDESYDTPKCWMSCENGYNVSYTDDKHYGLNSYIVPTEIWNMQVEIMKNGPIQSEIGVFEDFLTYQSGVYQHLKGKYLGSLSIKIIGWGLEDYVPYWLVVNSWNREWGDNGYIKILRGQGEVGIEQINTAGIPKL